MARFPIPTPFSVGPVNCYLLRGEEPALIDPGPATDEAYDELVGAIESAGLDLEDVEHVLFTHPHMDHFGLIRRIVQASDATVYAHRNAVERVTDPIENFRREKRFFRPFLLSMGMPTESVETVLELPDSYTNYQEPVAVDTELADGDVVDVGIELTCVSTPGHAPGSLCFRPSGEDLLITGDHVLPTVTPNPLLTLAPGTDDERTRSLPTYLDSLRTVRDLDLTVGYGGHGDPMPDLEDRIEETLSHHQDRKERIADMVAEAGPTTAYDLMRELFPGLPLTEMFSGMSEIIGHLELLEDEGRVELTERDGEVRYELATRA